MQGGREGRKRKEGGDIPRQRYRIDAPRQEELVDKTGVG